MFDACAKLNIFQENYDGYWKLEHTLIKIGILTIETNLILRILFEEEEKYHDIEDLLYRCLNIPLTLVLTFNIPLTLVHTFNMSNM